MIAHCAWLVAACLAGHSALLADQTHSPAFDRPLLQQVVESADDRSLPKNIALSRRAYDLGRHFWRTGDLDRSLGSFDAALRFDPAYALACAARATVRSQRGDHQGAIEDASRAIELDPKMPEAYYNRGVAYGGLRNWEQAAADYTEALRLAPTLGGGLAHHNRGSAFMAQGKLDDAIKDFTRAIELNPKNAVSYFNRSLAYERDNQNEHAMRDLKSVLELTPNFMEAHHRRALLFLKEGRDREALEDLNSAIRLYPKDVVAVADRALLHERLGNKDAALLDSKLVSEMSGKNPRTINRERHLSPY
jgi:tetratricopeptide (TPR) repeat protein